MSPLQRYSLFCNFADAAAVLREARNDHLSPSHPDTQVAVNKFFSELDQVEYALSHNFINPTNIIAIEALDGTGKTTLTRFLSGLHNGVEYVSKRTPPDSIRNVRSFFDAVTDERIARAFYMVGNYFLQHEMRHPAQNHHVPTVYIVDRYYASTCAYTLAWHCTGPGAPDTNVDSLPQHLFSWPSDLQPPSLTLILRASEHVRKQRVADRSLTAARTNNPWDDRLSHDATLAGRIARALTVVSSVSKVVEIDADQPLVEVQHAAESHIATHVRRLIAKPATMTMAPDTHATRVQSKPVRQRRLTVAVTGTHCAGKALVGRRIADELGEGWRFEPELGDELRQKESLVPGGHLTGDGSGSLCGKDWDAFVCQNEHVRDGQSWEKEGIGRVVETWHIGNVAWAALRAGGKVSDAFLQEARDAVRKDAERACVVFVHLSIDRKASVRRHRKHENVKRLPMDANKVEEECGKLHDMLEVWTLEELKKVVAADGCGSIRMLVVQNSEDGEEAMNSKVDEVVEFVKGL